MTTVMPNQTQLTTQPLKHYPNTNTTNTTNITLSTYSYYFSLLDDEESARVTPLMEGLLATKNKEDVREGRYGYVYC